MLISLNKTARRFNKEREEFSALYFKLNKFCQTANACLNYLKSHTEEEIDNYQNKLNIAEEFLQRSTYKLMAEEDLEVVIKNLIKQRDKVETITAFSSYEESYNLAVKENRILKESKGAVFTDYKVKINSLKEQDNYNQKIKDMEALQELFEGETGINNITTMKDNIYEQIAVISPLIEELEELVNYYKNKFSEDKLLVDIDNQHERVMKFAEEI